MLRIIEMEKKKNKQLQGTLEQTEDAAKYAVQQILQRLRVSEMRTGELEKRFSSISRPSTALLDAISHLDVGFMRQPLPGMDQLEMLEEKDTQPAAQTRSPTNIEPKRPQKRNEGLRIRTYPRRNKLPINNKISNYNGPKFPGPSGAWRTKNMKEAKTKLYGIRGTRSKKKFGSSSIYDYDFGEGGLQQ